MPNWIEAHEGLWAFLALVLAVVVWFFPNRQTFMEWVSYVRSPKPKGSVADQLTLVAEAIRQREGAFDTSPLRLDPLPSRIKVDDETWTQEQLLSAVAGNRSRWMIGGVAGVGKTYLARQLSLRSVDESLGGKPVVVVPARECHVRARRWSKTSSLSRYFQRYLFRMVSREVDWAQLIDGSHCTILLDGLDEADEGLVILVNEYAQSRNIIVTYRVLAPKSEESFLSTIDLERFSRGFLLPLKEKDVATVLVDNDVPGEAAKRLSKRLLNPMLLSVFLWCWHHSAGTARHELIRGYRIWQQYVKLVEDSYHGVGSPSAYSAAILCSNWFKPQGQATCVPFYISGPIRTITKCLAAVSVLMVVAAFQNYQAILCGICFVGAVILQDERC